MAINRSKLVDLRQLAKQPVFKAALVFAVGCLLLLSYRHYSLYNSYDQGIFNQIFWNNLHGRWFESSLSSGLSADVTHQGEIPLVSYRHLGQHFNPIFLLWLPLYALVPLPMTLSVIQVALVVAAGLVLYALARQSLSPLLSLAIAVSFYGANAVIGPTVGNFHDYNPLPLLLFSLFLAIEKRWWILFWAMALLVLSVREDAGVPLLSVAVYLVLRRRQWWIGLALFAIATAYILLLTNVVMPSFSPDVSQRLIVERFGQYTGGKAATPVEAIGAILSQPGQILAEIFSRFPKKLSYLVDHWLPLAFVPAIAADAWILAAFPFLELLLMRGETPLSINIRYATLAVPGLFYGAILWWSNHPKAFQPRMRRFWGLCLALSLLFTVTSNPNRSLSFLVPDSIRPWVYVPPLAQVQHASQARSVLVQIPPQASVAATTYLIPPLSGRRAIVRFPNTMQFRDEAQQTQNVDYIVADLWQMQQYQPAFKLERNLLQASIKEVNQLLQAQSYGIQTFQDGVILLQRGLKTEPAIAGQWQEFTKQNFTSVS
ncbi:MAG: DUF2079 domain-containing protein [Stenomitos rutilans HA7619-LM2]|jgi:uncharacterized membrane protein|nr:DUF2079 domain-containing protein [Stenomitos rutilans HA7619-LM2]